MPRVGKERNSSNSSICLQTMQENGNTDDVEGKIEDNQLSSNIAIEDQL